MAGPSDGSNSQENSKEGNELIRLEAESVSHNALRRSESSNSNPHSNITICSAVCKARKLMTWSKHDTCSLWSSVQRFSEDFDGERKQDCIWEIACLVHILLIGFDHCNNLHLHVQSSWRLKRSNWGARYTWAGLAKVYLKAHAF